MEPPGSPRQNPSERVAAMLDAPPSRSPINSSSSESTVAQRRFSLDSVETTRGPATKIKFKATVLKRSSPSESPTGTLPVSPRETPDRPPTPTLDLDLTRVNAGFVNLRLTEENVSSPRDAKYYSAFRTPQASSSPLSPRGKPEEKSE